MNPARLTDAERKQERDRAILVDALVWYFLERWREGYDWDEESGEWVERYSKAS